MANLRAKSGLFYMVLASVAFSLMTLLAKLVGQRVPIGQIILARSLISLIVTLWWLARARVSPWGNNRLVLCQRALLGFFALNCLFYSLNHLPLAEATVVQFSYPVFTTLLAALFLGESMSARLWSAIAVSFTGVGLISGLGFPDQALNLSAVLVGLLGALMTAGAYVSVRTLSKSEHPLVVIFYFPLLSAPLALLTSFRSFVWPSAEDWFLLLGVGITTQAGQIFITRGLFLERAGRATALTYLQPALAMLWGLIFFAELPPLSGLLGSLLVLAGSGLVLRGRVPDTP